MLVKYSSPLASALRRPQTARQAPALPPPTSSVRHYLPLAKLTLRLVEVATQACSTTLSKHFSWYFVWGYRLCVVVLYMYTCKCQAQGIAQGQVSYNCSKKRLLQATVQRLPPTGFTIVTSKDQLLQKKLLFFTLVTVRRGSLKVLKMEFIKAHI